MKRYISFLIITALLTAALAGLGGAALAGPDDADISLSPDIVSANVDDTVTITATITNNTEEMFTNYRVKLAGSSRTFGDDATLAPDYSGDITVNITVSEDMLNTDQTLTAEYKTDSAGDAWQEGSSATLRINGNEHTAKIDCSAKASQTKLAPGDQVTFTFDIENQGYVTLEDIEVKADNINKGKALNQKFSLNPGQSFSVVYKYTFSTSIVIEPYITYTVSGLTDPQRYDIAQPFELEEEERHVVVSLSVDNSRPQVGEEVTFTLSIKNEGNVDYTNLTVTYDGEDMGSPSRNLPQGADLEKKYKRSFDLSADVYFTITVKDHTGETRSANSNTIHILLPIDTQALKDGLKIVIEPDRDEFTSAGVVNFSGYISNDSSYTLSDVSVTESTLGEIYSISEMAADSKQSISYSADINETTTYTFRLSVKDRDGSEYTVDSEPMTVTILGSEEATADPAGDAPVVTLPPEETSSDPIGFLIVILIVLVVLIIGVGIALLVLWKGGRSPSRGSRPMASKAKRKPVRGGFKKPGRSRSFRDRNNF